MHLHTTRQRQEPMPLTSRRLKACQDAPGIGSTTPSVTLPRVVAVSRFLAARFFMSAPHVVAVPRFVAACFFMSVPRLLAAPLPVAAPFFMAALLFTSCAPGDRAATPRPEAEGAPAAPGRASPADTAQLPLDDRPVCLQGDAFVVDGPVDVSAAGGAADADQVGALRWQGHDGCERFVIDLLAHDARAAARAGEVAAEILRDLGIVRVTLRDVAWVAPAATDAGLGGTLARRAWSVRSPAGSGTWVDLHLGEAAEARVQVLDDPARVVVDLRPRPAGAPVPPPAPRSARVVVLTPRGGRAAYPLTVNGYARTFEANVVVRLEQEGRDTVERFTTATAWVDAWGYFSLTIEEGPPGPLTLHVGEYSARDGSWEGVAIDLEGR